MLIDFLGFINFKTSFSDFCCVLNRWESCIKQHLNEICGPKEPQIIVDLIDSGTMRLPDQFCPPSYFESKLCTSILPPLHTKAKGDKSN